ncbi:hypothetical protein A3D14_02685 [Candidatus Saccharibacteria bacterium RIFCSPHIGHO2_02_FULL_47_12]|nr:MAG: hypothetical protein A3D14_02685 [Candidatus Saccharibacteria bacterium RIFCSPHIGHO2_02_FULL_47_12]
MPESSRDLDPSYRERLVKWDELDHEMNLRASLMHGSEIEPVINNTAVGINAVLGGYFTRMSCEGHSDQAGSVPWVSFELGFGPPEETRIAGIKQLLEEFYRDRDSSSELRLEVYERTLGGSPHTLMTKIGHDGYEAFQTENQRGFELRNHESLELQQQEMADFAVFLKQKYLSGFKIDIPDDKHDNEESFDDVDDWLEDDPRYWSQDIADVLSHTQSEEFKLDAETIAEIAAMDFEEAFETAYSYLAQAGLDADGVLAHWIEQEKPRESDLDQQG